VQQSIIEIAGARGTLTQNYPPDMIKKNIASLSKVLTTTTAVDITVSSAYSEQSGSRMGLGRTEKAMAD